MTDFKYDPSVKLGMRPGEIVHIGEQKLDQIKVRVLDFNPQTIELKELSSIEECINYKNHDTLSWINIDGLHDTEAIARIGKDFNISNLVLEDIANTMQHPKFEEYEDYIFITTKMIYYTQDTTTMVFEHISFILGDKFVITFQERVGDIFLPVRERIKDPKSRLRNRGTDYLTYALLDVLVDNYFVILDKINSEVNDLEEQLMDSPTQETLKQMYKVKRELLRLNRNIRPVRDIANNLYSIESPLIEEKNKNFIRDLYDHTVDVNSSLDINREMVSGMIETYISITGNKLNEIMKVLTIMASIFIPLTFIAGIYGMNFDNMPELHARWGYHVTIIVMLIIAIVLVYYFRKKKWL